MTDPRLPIGAEYRRMVSGEPYRSSDPELVAARARARDLTFRFNNTPPDQRSLRRSLLGELLGTIGERCTFEPTLHVDYGFHVHLGERFYANANCVLLDVAPIRVGEDTMFGPGVQLLTATHPVDAQQRVSGHELGFPITIGRRVWLGGGVIVGPGVTIGDEVVVGAGAVVVRDLPPRVVAVGNPARPVRDLAAPHRQGGPAQPS